MKDATATRPATKPARISGRRKGQGWKWINVSTRFSIYHRDGFRCVYCGTAGDALGYGLTLDHLLACERGGSDSSSNLVTCCSTCNSRKQDLTMRAWYAALRADGVDTTPVRRRIRRLVGVDVARGKHRIAGRAVAAARTAHATRVHAARKAAKRTAAILCDLAKVA